MLCMQTLLEEHEQSRSLLFVGDISIRVRTRHPQSLQVSSQGVSSEQPPRYGSKSAIRQTVQTNAERLHELVPKNV